MNATVKSSSHSGNAWLEQENVSLLSLEKILSQAITPDDVPCAVELVQQVPVYDAQMIRQQITDNPAFKFRRAWQAELAWVWSTGPSIAVVRNAFPDHAVVD